VPVIHKETIQPEVIHTTKPIHETHHAASQHHGISALPMKTLDEFKRSGGSLDGNKVHAHEEYDGCPKTYNKDLQTTTEKLGFGKSSTPSNVSTSNPSHNNGLGVAGAGATAAGAGIAGTKVAEHHRKDSGVADVGRKSSHSSASSSDFEYAADGTKVKKGKIGQLLDKVRSGSKQDTAATSTY
jgi:hypothetical protein